MSSPIQAKPDGVFCFCCAQCRWENISFAAANEVKVLQAAKAQYGLPRAYKMNVDSKIVCRLEELIEMGERVLATKVSPPSNYIGYDSSVDTSLSHQWATQVQNILSRVFGEESPHYKNFSEDIRHLTYGPARRMQGVLRAALDDYSNGYLFDVKRIVEADVFSDMLEQAVHLEKNGYSQAAMVIAGAVLEDTLRRLCVKHNVDIGERPKLERMNAELTKAGVYNSLTQKRITAIAGVRNSAAHGKLDEFTKSDARDAIAWIRNFVETRYA